MYNDIIMYDTQYVKMFFGTLTKTALTYICNAGGYSLALLAKGDVNKYDKKMAQQKAVPSVDS